MSTYFYMEIGDYYNSWNLMIMDEKTEQIQRVNNVLNDLKMRFQ